MPTQSSNKHDLREFINLFQINCYFHGKGVDVFLITNLTPMSTIFRVWIKDGRGPDADWRTRTGGRGLADADCARFNRVY